MITKSGRARQGAVGILGSDRRVRAATLRRELLPRVLEVVIAGVTPAPKALAPARDT